jgi:hypothetical protein
VADGWCWFVVREKYCWLVAGGWFVLREKYCWLVADKPNEQAAGFPPRSINRKGKYFIVTGVKAVVVHPCRCRACLLHGMRPSCVD